MSESRHQKDLCRACDELIAAGNGRRGVSLRGRFVSAQAIRLALEARGYALTRDSGSAWFAEPLSARETRQEKP